MTGRHTFHLDRLAGIPIGIQPLWLVVVGLITYALGHDWFLEEDPGLEEGAAYALGLLSALLLFAGILLHELGHAVVARRRGVEVDEIDLWLLGGVSRLHGEPRQAGDELRFALAGPAVTAVILAVMGALRLALGDAGPAWARALLDYQLLVNALILGFNLLPAFPLDGGRVVRSLLWRRSGDRATATATAAAVGTAFGWGMIALGVLSFLGGAPGGLWLALVGGFLIVAAGAESRQVSMQASFGAATAGQLMSAPAISLADDLSLDRAVREGFARHLFTAFPVVDHDGRAIGVLTIDAVRAVPAADRLLTTVGHVAVRDPALLVPSGAPVTQVLTAPAFARVGRAVVVDALGCPLGVLSVTDVQRRLRAYALEQPPRVGEPV